MIGAAGRAMIGGRLGAIAPVPFVGAAAILVALIVFTPVLLASGPSPLAVQAKLEVYRTVGSPMTEFTINALGDVPYARLDLGLGTGFVWTGSCPAAPLHWNYTNGTDEVDLNVQTNETPVVVNATAVYDRGGAVTVFAGEIAFDIVNPGAPSEALELAPCAGTPGVSPPGSWSVSQLPLTILLVNFGSGGPP